MPLTRHWCQYTRGILWEAESHRAKAEVNQTSDENQLTVLGRNTNHMEMDRVLQLRGDKVVTRSNAKPEGAELGPWHLSPALHHTQGPEQDYFPVWGKMSLFKLIQTSTTGCCPESYSLELCNKTSSFLCSSDPWKCQGVNEILLQLLQVEAAQSFFCPAPSCVDREPAAGLRIPRCSQGRFVFAFPRRLPSASGGQPSPIPLPLF